jgi:hypothetical protein
VRGAAIRSNQEYHLARHPKKGGVVRAEHISELHQVWKYRQIDAEIATPETTHHQECCSCAKHRSTPVMRL